jgi:cathepsin X
VEEYGNVTGDAAIMAEIYARGPLVCYIDAGPLEDYTGGVNMYEGAHGTNHAIALLGWGETGEGLKYWIGRNSWGSYWGEQGWFRIVRGGAFDAGTCFWAVPRSDFRDYGVGGVDGRVGGAKDGSEGTTRVSRMEQ